MSYRSAVSCRSRRNAIFAAGVWIAAAALSPILGPPLAGQARGATVGQAPDSACSPLETEAARVSALRDSDAAVGLAEADSLTGRARAARCGRAEIMAQAARADNLLTLGRYAEAREQRDRKSVV